VNVSRTVFLKICGAVLLGRTVDASSLFTSIGGAFSAAAAGWPVAPFRVDEASASVFQPHLNSTFAVRATEGTRLPFVLVRVTERALTPDVEQFSLSFHAPPGTPLPDGTHAFQHGTLGEFDLFIAAVGGVSAPHTVYEACFSRHVSSRESVGDLRHDPAARERTSHVK
jgi:uncharacterized protein DUF6916